MIAEVLAPRDVDFLALRADIVMPGGIVCSESIVEPSIRKCLRRNLARRIRIWTQSIGGRQLKDILLTSLAVITSVIGVESESTVVVKGLQIHRKGDIQTRQSLIFILRLEYYCIAN